MTETKTDTTQLGPVDILILEFQGNKFNGDILRAIYDQVASGTIRIIDLVVITKGKTGLVSATEIADLGTAEREALAPLRASISQMITNDDIYEIGSALSENSTAGVLLYENTWASQIKKAMLEANGRVIAYERIPHEVVTRTLEDLAAMEASAR